jgi:hypothetical protein
MSRDRWIQQKGSNAAGPIQGPQPAGNQSRKQEIERRLTKFVPDRALFVACVFPVTVQAREPSPLADVTARRQRASLVDISVSAGKWRDGGLSTRRMIRRLACERRVLRFRAVVARRLRHPALAFATITSM